MKKAKSTSISKNKATTRKAAWKKRPSRATKKKSAAPKRKKAMPKKPAGYEQTKRGILAPSGTVTPVPPNKICKGLSKAKKEISQLIEEIVLTMPDEYSISEMELSASFNAEGKFLGIGVVGSTSITIRVKPEARLEDNL